MKLVHTQTLSGKGDRPEEFRTRLAGICVDTADRLFAVGDREIKRFTLRGEMELRFPVHAASWSLTVNGEQVWVGRHGEIAGFDLEGTLQSRIEDPQRLGRITGLAVRGETLLAADATNRTIHLYHGGKWQRQVGNDVNTRGFMLPNGVLDLALDAEQEVVLVAHPQKHRVERYSLEGELIDKFGRFGMAHPADFGGCCNPTNITAMAKGLIAVSEKAPPRVKVYTSKGEFVAQSADGIFNANTKNIDLAADSRGRLYATTPRLCTIEVFELTTDGD